MIVADELVADEFTAPASELERYHYGWSVVACLPAAMGDPQTSATGAMMRAATLRRYAEQAASPAWRSCRWRPRPGVSTG